ncbi:MAG: FAD-dependent oxidoreductase [Candidatus Eisenbacteria bacterium]
MKKPKFISEFKDIPSKRQKMPELPLEERSLNFDEVELGLSEEMVLKEAARCLSCRRCIGCGLCLAECDPKAIVYDEAASRVDLEADAVIFTSDGQAYNPAGKKELGYADAANVITSFEFERLVSPTGPFGGLLVRPFDGDVPKRIAFIQCVGSREEGIGANFCSSDCCSRTFSQANHARKLTGDAEVHVFHRGLRPVGKRSELILSELQGEKWIEFTEAEVVSVREDPRDGTVSVEYSVAGKTAEAQFDLVVLAVGIHALDGFKRYARTAGIRVNKFGFIERSIGSLIAGTDAVSFGGAVCGPAPVYRSVIDALAASTRSLNSSGTKPPRQASRSKGKTSVHACEYGLELAGVNRSDVEGLCSVHPFLCYRDGRAAMSANLNETSSIVVVGCHKGSHEELFEQVCGLPGGSVTIMAGEDLTGDLKANLASIMEGSPAAQPRPEAGSDKKPASVVVVGGGTSGLAAASELVRRGVEVTVVEKSAEIGRPLIFAAMVEGTEVDAVDGFVKALETNPGATVLKEGTVASVKKSAGKITVMVSTPKGEKTLEAGAMLIATGAGAYVPVGCHHGEDEAILTQSEFRQRINEGRASWKRVAMIQCVGARTGEHPYCSRYCCKQALANVLRFKQDNPDAEVTVFHRGIRVFGFEEDLYTDAGDLGVDFVEITGEPRITTDGALKVAADSTDGKSSSREFDAVVLSVGHLHGPDHEELARVSGVTLDDLRFLATGDPLAAPFATTASGIFACGFARSPVIAEEAFVDGVGAAGAICKYLGV